MSYNKVILLLGSNLGNREAHLLEAIALIETRLGKVSCATEIADTEPVEFVSNNYFCNIAIVISTQKSPFSVLGVIKNIEKEMGRLLDSFTVGSYTDRIIDIDIVQFNNIRYESEILEIPHHKHLYEREFSKVLLENLNEKIKTQI